MDLTRTRSLLLTAACLLGVAAIAGGCSATTETVSSTGTAGGTKAADTANEGTAGGGPAQATTGSTSGSSFDPVTSQATTAARIPETTIADPDTTLAPPDPTVVPTIPASGPDPALIDCGILYRASGWPTTMIPSPDAFTCLQDAFTAGTPARLVDREQTDGYGGAILVTTYDVLGAGRVRVTVDAREAVDRPQGITVSECTGLTAVPVTITPSGCTVVSS